jgi:predicted Zn finger-like uncharacterized protein
MIAGCPKCGARYRVEREKLAAGGVRLRCAKCDSVFRVRAPEGETEANDRTQIHLDAPPPAPAPAPRAAPAPVAMPAPAPVAVAPVAPPSPSGELVLIAIPEADIAKQLAGALEARGLRTIVTHDGVDAVLELQRQLPRAAIVAAHLPKMFGFQVCELVKRNESLRATWIVLVGAIHNQERYRRPARETYGADAYLEMPDLPEGALPLLEQGGIALAPAAAPAPRRGAPAPLRTVRESAPQQVAPAAAPLAAEAAPARARAADGLDEQRAKAERLARIIVSDIVLYNEQKFSEAIRTRNVVEALDGDLAEGRHLFQERIDARVRAERDYLADELLRVAKQRGMK